MKIISWNVNGIRAVHNKNLLIPFLEQENPDIVCLQETKAMQGQAEIDLPQYEEYWHSAERKGYSGVAVFSKIKPESVFRGFKPHILKDFDLKDKYGDANTEGRVITLEFKDFFLVNVYTPNAKPDLSRLKLRHETWDKAFLAHCKELETVKPVVFCGDLNVAHTPLDLARPEENEGEHGFTKEEREGLDKIIEGGFIDTFRMFHTEGGNYTWWSAWGTARARNIGWRIDYFFVSESLRKHVKQANILKEVKGSDHCPVSLELEIKNS
jgi:exodeoxyribonuclease-3